MVWDPMSVSQTSRLSALVNNLIESFPTMSSKSKNTVSLLEAISSKIITSLDEDTFMPLYSKESVVYESLVIFIVLTPDVTAYGLMLTAC